MTDPYAHWDASRVLGALPTAHRHEYEHHLATCAHCQHQVAELSGMPGMLALARSEEADEAALTAAADAVVPAPFYAGLAARVVHRRRRLLLAAGAGVLAVAGTTAALAAGMGSCTAPPPSAISSVAPGLQLTFPGVPPRGLQATGTLVRHAWGTQIDWQCSYPPATMATPVGSIARLDIRDSAGATLLSAVTGSGP